MHKTRIALRLPESLIASLDRAAAAQSRTRSNYVDLVLTLATGVVTRSLHALEADVVDKRTELITIRVADKTWRRVQESAGSMTVKRSASDLVARILMGSTEPGWSERVASLPQRRRGAHGDEPHNVFA